MDQITYNHGMVSDLASDVGQSAAQLLEMHDDVQQRTNAIADFFEGKAGTAFHEAQMQMLQGLFLKMLFLYLLMLCKQMLHVLFKVLLL